MIVCMLFMRQYPILPLYACYVVVLLIILCI